MTPMNYAHLAQYRHTVAEHYAAVRAESDPEMAALTWRANRDELFLNHPLTPLTDAQRDGFAGIPYAEYDPAWRIVAELDFDVEEKIYMDALPEGDTHYKRVAKTRFNTPHGPGELTLFWVMGYGGGIFLAFGDATNKTTTYGGGRYLYDTIKGADLGLTDTHIMLDFNFAYHPSCHYNPIWTCPLAPPENKLPFPVPVGELAGD